MHAKVANSYLELARLVGNLAYGGTMRASILKISVLDLRLADPHFGQRQRLGLQILLSLDNLSVVSQ